MEQKLNQIEVGKFNFTLPEAWEYTFDNGVINIFNEALGVGVIQISHFEISEGTPFILFDEFYDFISDLENIKKDSFHFYNRIKKIREDFLTLEILKESNFFIYGMIYNSPSLIFITYNCNNIDRNKETDKVYKFFNDIQFIR